VDGFLLLLLLLLFAVGVITLLVLHHSIHTTAKPEKGAQNAIKELPHGW
jgi:hypothetical protein